MKRFEARQAYLVCMLILSVFLITGCGNSTGHFEASHEHHHHRDTTPPTVTFTVPANGATGVAVNTKISATFSEKMDPATITRKTFTVKHGATAVFGTVTYSGVTAVFTPASNLAFSTTYTATITTGAQDRAGNPLAGNQAPFPGPSDYVWSFTTGKVPDTTKPTVTFVVPPNKAVGVAVNTQITATFSEAMDPATITTATFTVRHGTTAVLGTVTYSGVTAVFTPVANLAHSTTYFATITTGATDLAGNPLASNYVWRFTTGAAPDTTPPTVTFVVPANGATGVHINTKITATFSEAMDPLTITTATFTVRQGTTAVLGTVTYSGVTAVFAPASNLAFSTTYTATITAEATDLAGNPLAGNQAPFPGPSDYVWTFTTGAAPDTTPPTVTFVVPANGATGVHINTKITATFSEAMDPLTITTATFTVRQGTTPVLGTVIYSGVTAVFAPVANLAYSTTYTATITTGATDLAGNPLAGNQAPFPAPSNYVWTFTTGAAPDTTPPTVTFVVPANGATDVPINTKITATFSEAMDPLTITTATFTVKQGATPVLGTVIYSGVTAVFTPVANLAYSTTYTATITTGATDLAGNPLAGNQAPFPAPSNYVWTFTTGPVPDTTPPTVTFTDPADGATGVHINTKITATFSEAMDPLTITTATFTVRQGTTPVLGTVIYSGVTAVFTPVANLAYSTTYTATITTGATDLAGNALGPGLVPNPWSFTTGQAPDITPPTVILTVPANGDIDVPLNSAVNATFSEAMDPLTITTATFTVQASGPPLVGTVAYDPLTHIATFTPTANLAVSTQYTATVTTGATDLAGNALGPGPVPNPWTFTTGTGIPPGRPPLGSAGTFGIMATSAITNTGFSTINGDVSLDPGTSITGFPPGVVNGTVHINDTVSAQARADLLVAYNFAKTLPPGTIVPGGSDLGALYPLGMPPGTYTSGSTMLVSTPLVLDAGGNANAVWVFQIGSSMTTGASVSLANGAQAKNVFWVPTASATIGVGTIFHGTIVAGISATGQTGAVINGRILAGAIGAGTIALDTNTVNVPAP